MTVEGAKVRKKEHLRQEEEMNGKGTAAGRKLLLAAFAVLAGVFFWYISRCHRAEDMVEIQGATTPGWKLRSSKGNPPAGITSEEQQSQI